MSEHDQPRPSAARGRRVITAGVVVAVIVVVAVTGVAFTVQGDDRSDDDSTALVVRQSDDGSTVKVAAGEQIDVRLEENPSTGYLWRSSAKPDADTLEAIDDDWKVDDDCEDGMTGCGGVHTYRFQAGDEPGATKVAFELHSRQPGEVVERFEVTVRVR